MIIKSEFQPQYAHLSPYFEEIKTIFANDTQTIHKARNELKIISLDEEKMVVKSFQIPHLLNRIVYSFFRKSKAYKSYHNALHLTNLEISTPTPVSYIEFYSANLLKNSYFISLYNPYDFTIREALHHKCDDYFDVLRQFAAYTYDLHQKGVWHLDYSPGNILVQRMEKGYRFSIVDINRMAFREITPFEGCENFNKLWARDEDIEIMGREYARLSGLDETVAISEMKRHNNANKRVKNLKKRLKKVLRGDFSDPA